MSFERPRFDQPKTPEIIKTPAEVANELRKKIIDFNERLQRTLATKEGLKFQCEEKRYQAACGEISKVEQRIVIIQKERDKAAEELEKVLSAK